MTGGRRSIERSRRVVRYLNALPGKLETLVIPGDIADRTAPEGARYEAALELAEMSRTTVMFCPGNHDVRSDFWSAILDRDGGETPVNVLYRTGRMAVAMLDTSVPGRGEGYLDDETLEWLDKTLTGAEDNVPVFVGFHHPPVRLHSDYVDPIRQYGGERFGDVLARHRVAGLLCGHVHTAAVTRFGGIPLIAAGGVVNTVLAGWEADTIPTFDTDQPPVVAFHVYVSAGRLTTHFRVVV